jgi:5-formyltetrahydrofolate cyclo-ligase
MMKNELREHVLTQRGAIEPAARLLWDQLIFERAHKHRAFQLARRVHVYRSVRDEVETLPLIEYAWGIGKDVFVPVVPPGSTTMRHCKVTWRTEWREGAFGILEPANAVAEDYVDESSFFDEGSAIVVPLVAFDRSCNRLGYGKGYYDRFLRATSATSIGIAYELQRTMNVGPEEHDVPLHCVATQERWYVASSQAQR